MNKIDIFRTTLRVHIDEPEKSQSIVSKETGVPQYVISRFLSGSEIHGKHLLPLVEYLQQKETKECNKVR